MIYSYYITKNHKCKHIGGNMAKEDKKYEGWLSDEEGEGDA